MAKIIIITMKKIKNMMILKDNKEINKEIFIFNKIIFIYYFCAYDNMKIFYLIK